MKTEEKREEDVRLIHRRELKYPTIKTNESMLHSFLRAKEWRVEQYNRLFAWDRRCV